MASITNFLKLNRLPHSAMAFDGLFMHFMVSILSWFPILSVVSTLLTVVSELTNILELWFANHPWFPNHPSCLRFMQA